VKKLYLQFGASPGPFLTEEAEAVRETELPPNPYASGYGAKIPTRYMLKTRGRWRRVYCAQFSNAGTAWVTVDRERVTVTEA
jgi:hypothetical protein